MAYVDYTYYTDVYFGASLEADDWNRYEARAEEAIDLLCRGRIASGEIASNSPAVQTLVRKAICAQIEYYIENGIEVAVGGIKDSGFTVGKVTVHGASGAAAKAATGAQTMISPQAIAFLEQTGLINPAVGSVGVPGFWGWF